MEISKTYNRWVEIQLDTLADNYRTIRNYLPRSIKIMAVVKANGYGFGAVAAAKIFVDCGVDALAVTTLDEAIELRLADITTPTLVFAPLLPEEISLYAQYDLMPTIANLPAAKALGQAAEGVSLCYHLKINTGMNRMGILPQEIPLVLEELKKCPQHTMGGVYSHFATALDANTSFAKKQFHVFQSALEQVRAGGFMGFTAHLANSAGMLRLAEARLDMVRIGSILYGQLPLAKSFDLSLKDPFTVCAKIIDLQQINKGDSVGYGRDFIAKRNMELAVIPIGYADGFAMTVQARPLNAKRAFQEMSKNMGKVVLKRPQNGVYWGVHRLPVVGRVSMQCTVFDVTGIGARLGQTVTVPMRKLATNARLPRVYLQEGQIVGICDILERQQEMGQR